MKLKQLKQLFFAMAFAITTFFAFGQEPTTITFEVGAELSLNQEQFAALSPEKIDNETYKLTFDGVSVIAVGVVGESGQFLGEVVNNGQPVEIPIPDTFHFEVDGQRVTVITTDAKDFANFIISEREKLKEDPPKSAGDWLTYILGLFVAGGLLARITQAMKVIDQLKTFFSAINSPANFVGLAAVGLAALAPLIIKGNYWEVFFNALPWLFTGATLVYVNFLKKKKDIDPQPVKDEKELK